MKKQDFWVVNVLCILVILIGLALYGYTVVGLRVFNGLSLTGLIWVLLGVGFYKV